MTRARNDAQRRADSGFTLVEVLTAIVILVFGLIAVTNLLVVAGSSSTVANMGTTAAALGTEQMEVLKALPFPAGFAGPTLTPGGDLNNNLAGFYRDSAIDPRLNVPGGGNITVRWQVTQVQNQLMHIRVRAEADYGIARGRTRVDFTTFRACTAPVADLTLGCVNNVGSGDSTPCCPAAP